MKVGNMSDAQNLLDLQAADLVILRSRRKLEALPQKETIIHVREKRKEVILQRAKVVDMIDDIDQRVAQLEDEDANLVKSIAEAQATLDSTKDYRLVNSITKEMEGYVKRREKVSFELGNLSERAGKTVDVKKRADQALLALDQREKREIESYKVDGGVLQSEMKAAQAQRDAIAATLPQSLMDRYTKLAKTKGGIAVSQLQGRMCSVCHVEYQEGQVLQISQEGEIATCPNCNRMLIVGEAL